MIFVILSSKATKKKKKLRVPPHSSLSLGAPYNDSNQINFGLVIDKKSYYSLFNTKMILKEADKILVKEI